jgi:hypothetical protein
MESRLAEYRSRKRKEAAKQFLYNMVTINSQQHISETARNLSVSTPQKVRYALLRSSFKQLNMQRYSLLQLLK